MQLQHGDMSVGLAATLLAVLTGTSDVPVRRQVEALVKSGYRGYQRRVCSN